MTTPYDVLMSVPDLGQGEADAARRGASAWGAETAGDIVREFEQGAARLLGVDQVVATSSGTAALHLALVAAGIGPGDRVIVPDWTFGATANAVLYTGARPVLVDVDRESWTLDPALVEQLLDGAIDVGGPIRGVIAVHALGHPPHMRRLAEACSRHGVALIEDSAGAIGARYDGLPAGCFGDAGILSFNGNKTVSCGGGGVVTSRHADWMVRARAALVDEDALLFEDEAPDPRADGALAYDMHPVCAAIGVEQLRRTEELVASKIAIAARYDAAIAGRADLLAMPRRPWAESACWMYSALCGSGADAEALVAAMGRARIQARVFWQGLSTQTPYARLPRLLTGVSDELSERVVALPCSSGLDAERQQHVIDVLNAWRGASTVEDCWRFS